MVCCLFLIYLLITIYSSDPAIKQYLLHLDDSGELGRRFVIEDLDPTHLFVQPEIVSVLETKIDEFLEKLAYSKD